ncbi:uncharacterized protein LOC142227591 [Haematobia irritans]|uniref:uncharacterized protein LOC142227591 n=1 Tax=Haematobia irritans TaxID=7368 RepID=UPI003F4F9400
MDVLTKYRVFGDTRCYMYSVEWQKRGLPHALILILLLNKLHSNEVDDIISAEIPDPVTDPHLYDIVTTQMVHGPCGALNPLSPCMADGKCTKRYPRPAVAETVTGNEGYPVYRRSSKEDSGRTIKVKVKTQDIEMGNKFIVPYCNISRSSAMGKLLMQYKHIVWDECTMAHKKSHEALNFTLKNLRRSNNIFGGLMILLADDFRQTLPVIPRRTPADELKAWLKASPLWNDVKTLSLTANMRVQLQNDQSC